MPQDEPQEASTETAYQTRRLLIITTIVLIGTVTMIGWHYFLAAVLLRPYSVSTFLFSPGDRFMDFFNDFARAKTFIAGTSTVIDYTPWAHLLVTALTPLPATLAFIVEMLAFGGTLWFMLRHYFLVHVSGWALKVQTFFVLALMTYPVLFLVDRGNHESIVFVFLFWFLYLYYEKKSPWSVVFLAAAIAMKLFPATLLILFIADRRYREGVLAVVTATGMMAAGVLGLKLLSGHSAHEVVNFTIATLVQGHGQGIAMGGGGVQHSHTFWGVLNVLALLGGKSAAAVAGYWLPYAVACLVAFGLVSAYVIFIERRVWAKVALLTICAIILPYVSGDYTLIHLFLPIMLFVGAPHQEYDLTIAVAFALLLVPMDFFYRGEVSTSVLIYPALMSIVVILILVEGFAIARDTRRRAFRV